MARAPGHFHGGAVVVAAIDRRYHALSGPARAMQDVGAAIVGAGSRVGAAISDFAQKRQNLQDLTADTRLTRNGTS